MQNSTNTIEELARQAKNEYARAWRKQNKAKIRQYDKAYWQRRAQKLLDAAKQPRNNLV